MIHRIHEAVWGPWMLVVFLAMGIYLTIGSGFFQIRGFGKWWRATAGSLMGKKQQGEKSGGVTSFQTACTALAATIGTGNIVGVATALTAGGAGAIFWMWVSAGIGMITAYGEGFLGTKYRHKAGKVWISGPMVILDKRLSLPFLGLLYGFFCTMSSLGMGSMVQANSLSLTAAYSFSIPPVVSAVVVTVSVALVIGGGTRRIAAVSEKLIPVASGIYMLFSMLVILMCMEHIPEVLKEIFSSAFSLEAAAGGTAGYGVSRSIQYGISRGVFSNEAGLGTLAIIHGAADHADPKEQGMWAMFEVFFDTIVICTLTALVILLTVDHSSGWQYDGAALTAFCFSVKLGTWGEYLVSLSMIVFAFGTMVAWFYMGRQAFEYLWMYTPLSNETIGRKLYFLLYLNAIFLGSLAKLSTVWELSDIWNGLMAVPNMTALFLLRKEIRKNIP